jgi:hypothetical protein
MRIPHFVTLLLLAACDGPAAPPPVDAPRAPSTREAMLSDMRREIALLGMSQVGDDTYYRWLKPAATRLAIRHGREEAEAFAAIARTGPHHIEQRLAILTLSQLAVDDVGARSTFIHLIASELEYPDLACLGYMDIEAAQPVAIQLASNPKAHIREQAYVLSCLIGNGGERTSLMETIRRIRGDARKPYEDWLRIYDHRLALDSTQQRHWARCGMVFWCAVNEPPGNCSMVNDYISIANRISLEAPDIPQAMVEIRLESQDPVAALLMGHCAFDGAAEKLGAHTAEFGFVGNAARQALAMLGTTAARRRLEDCLSPGGKLGLYYDVTRLLSRTAGDEDSASLLDRLSEDARYDDKTRKQFKEGAAGIRKRLNQ